jgi:hypothetical protein
MAASDKQLDAMRANPKGNWRIEDFETIAAANGVKVRKPGGSHVVFSFPGHFRHVTVPARRPIKPLYVRNFVAFIDEIRE